MAEVEVDEGVGVGVESSRRSVKRSKSEVSEVVEVREVEVR